MTAFLDFVPQNYERKERYFNYLLFNYISITTLHFSHKSHENDTIDPREKRSVYWFVSPSGTWSELTWVAYSSLHSVANEWLDAEY